MIHYLLIRRELPFGVTLAQLAHAAANSMNDWSYQAEWKKRDEPMTVVVLGVRNLHRLNRAANMLDAKGIKWTGVYEPDEPWNDQMMAIGVWPGDREELAPLFENYELYTEFEGPKC